MKTDKPDYVTPPTIGKRLGVSSEKVVGWILAGELRGCNLAATTGGKRPRWRVAEADLAEFIDRRAAVAPAVPRRRRASSARRFY